MTPTRAAATAAAVIPPQATFLGIPPFPEAARRELGNSQQRTNLHHAARTIRGRRQQRVDELDDWQELRSAGAAVKEHTLRHLTHYLEQFEAAASAAGATVHWPGTPPRRMGASRTWSPSDRCRPS